MLFTGDTRPIPEMLNAYACQNELIVHDCGLVGNPSHSGVDDIEREYTDEQRARLLLYHYGSKADGVLLQQRGYRIATARERIALASVDLDTYHPKQNCRT